MPTVLTAARLRATRSFSNLSKRLSHTSISFRRLIPPLFLLLLTPVVIYHFFARPLFAPSWTRAPHQQAIHGAREVWKPHGLLSERLEHELWNKVKNDVVIGIKTGHEVSRVRLKKLRAFGWWSVGRHVPNILVISDQPEPQLGVMGIKDYAASILHNASVAAGKGAYVQHGDHVKRDDIHDMPKHWFDKTGWRGDKDKNLPAFHMLRTVFPNKKWYLLLDDDTYIFLENFARYILQPNKDSTPLYTGKVFYISRCGGFHGAGIPQNRSQPRGMFAHGGSGIVVNGKAMDHLYDLIPACIREYCSCWAGDMQVALCLRKAGIMIKKVPGTRSYERHFIPFWPSKALADRRYSKRWRSNEEPITFHKIPDKEMELMSQLEKKAIASANIIRYTDLRLHLMSNGIVPCHTAHNKKTKYYSTEFMPAHLK